MAMNIPGIKTEPLQPRLHHSCATSDEKMMPASATRNPLTGRQAPAAKSGNL
ncbi:MAG: hypothetical protein AB7E29_03730 [Xanthobacter sp.]